MANKSFAIGLLTCALLSFLAGCPQGDQAQGDGGSKKQQTVKFLKLQERIKFLGSPDKLELSVLGGDNYDSIRMGNVKNMNNLWELLIKNPDWHEAAKADDYTQGMSSCSFPSWRFRFTLESESRKTLVEFDVDPDTSTAVCYADKQLFGILNISENQVAINSLVVSQTRKGVKQE